MQVMDLMKMQKMWLFRLLAQAQTMLQKCVLPKLPYLTMMLSAPRGVTKMAGANAYAAKFAISPTIIDIIPIHHNGSTR